MIISLNSETQALIAQRLRDGSYASADALVLAAFEAMDKCMADLEEYKTKLDRQLQVGIDELDEGQYVDGTAFFASLEAKYR
jgi:Arc/MetJ-type ribon-helix-helix transcriptional regulator